jgi:hypothetical protein
MTINSRNVPADIKTPHGLKLGMRIQRNGKTFMRYKQGKQYDELTAKEAVECIEGIKIKELIIIPDNDASS